MTLCSLSTISSFPAAECLVPTASPAQTYVLEKLCNNDLVFMGTTHQQPAILDLMAGLLPRLRGSGATHLALEIASDQQVHIDQYLSGQASMDEIVLHPAIDCPQYRHLLEILASLPDDQRPQVRAVDLPPALYGETMDRDQWIAARLMEIFQGQPCAKVLVELGSLHVLRVLNWRTRIMEKHRSIQSWLRTQHPGRSMFAIVNIVPEAEPACDFGRLLGPLPGIAALDVDSRFTGWRLGLTHCIAIEPAEPYDLVDGVIVY